MTQPSSKRLVTEAAQATAIGTETTRATAAEGALRNLSDSAFSTALSATFAGLNPTVASVVRDSAGRIQSLTENGVTVALTRDTSGRVATVTTGTTTRTVSRDTAGRVSGVA